MLQCTVPSCNRTLRNQKYLSQHIKVDHEGQKPYPCDYPGCTKRFKENSDLNRHKRTHTKLLQCGEGGCDRTFSKRYPLNRHIRRDHRPKAKKLAPAKNFDGSYQGYDSAGNNSSATRRPIHKDSPVENASFGGDDPCIICGKFDPDDGDDGALLCDRCNGTYHIKCLGIMVPDKEWLCKPCSTVFKKKFLLLDETFCHAENYDAADDDLRTLEDQFAPKLLEFWRIFKGQRQDQARNPHPERADPPTVSTPQSLPTNPSVDIQPLLIDTPQQTPLTIGNESTDAVGKQPVFSIAQLASWLLESSEQRQDQAPNIDMPQQAINDGPFLSLHSMAPSMGIEPGGLEWDTCSKEQSNMQAARYPSDPPQFADLECAGPGGMTHLVSDTHTRNIPWTAVFERQLNPSESATISWRIEFHLSSRHHG